MSDSKTSKQGDRSIVEKSSLSILDSTRLSRDAGKIAEEVIARLVGLVGTEFSVTPEIEAKILDGVPDNVVRTVTEN